MKQEIAGQRPARAACRGIYLILVLVFIMVLVLVKSLMSLKIKDQDQRILSVSVVWGSFCARVSRFLLGGARVL